VCGGEDRSRCRCIIFVSRCGRQRRRARKKRGHGGCGGSCMLKESVEFQYRVSSRTRWRISFADSQLTWEIIYGSSSSKLIDPAFIFFLFPLSPIALLFSPLFLPFCYYYFAMYFTSFKQISSPLRRRCGDNVQRWGQFTETRVRIEKQRKSMSMCPHLFKKNHQSLLIAGQAKHCRSVDRLLNILEPQHRK